MAQYDGLLDYLNKNNIQYQLLSHPSAYTAHQTALASHVPERTVAKTILVRADHQYWLVVLRGDHRINQRLLGEALGAKHVHLVPEHELESFFPDCELSAMPPFGDLYDLPVIVEWALTEDEEILINACTHRDAVRMRYSEFERLAVPRIAHFAEEPEYADEWDRSTW